MAPWLIASVFFVFFSIPAFADALTGKVVKVADGDTITVLDNTNTQHRIRLVLAAIAIGFRFRGLSL